MASYIDLNDLGSFASINALWAAHPEGGQEGDYCTIASVKYRWDKYDRMWVADPNFGPTPARSVTTFDGDVNMQNNLTVAGYIRAKGIKQPCVGLFASLAALEAKWPEPEVGMWALVGNSISSTSPAAVYRCDTEGTWTATGGSAYLDNVEFSIATGIAGWEPISSTSQLPTDPTPDQQGRGYLLGTMLYVYVGTGGDTLSGKYQSAQLKGATGETGPQGPSGVHEDDVTIANNLTTDDPLQVLSAKQGVEVKGLIGKVAIPRQTTVPANKYLNYSVGDTVDLSISIGWNGYYVFMGKCAKGDLVKFGTMKGNNITPYYIVDEDLKVLSVGAKHNSSTPVSIPDLTVEDDDAAYIIINSRGETVNTVSGSGSLWKGIDDINVDLYRQEEVEVFPMIFQNCGFNSNGKFIYSGTNRGYVLNLAGLNAAQVKVPVGALCYMGFVMNDGTWQVAYDGSSGHKIITADVPTGAVRLKGAYNTTQEPPRFYLITDATLGKYRLKDERYIELKDNSDTLLSIVETSQTGRFAFQTVGVMDYLHAFDELSYSFPGFVKQTKLGDSQTPLASKEDQNTYPINHYTYTKPGATPTKKFVLAGGLHGDSHGWTDTGGDSPQNIITIYYFLLDLFLHCNEDPFYKDLTDNYVIEVLPVMNPWGVQNHSRYNGRDVDLNRNFDCNWEDYASEHKGTAPFSEAESYAISTFINGLVNDGGFERYIEIHSRGEIILPGDNRWWGVCASTNAPFTKGAAEYVKNKYGGGGNFSVEELNYPGLWCWIQSELEIPACDVECAQSIGYDINTRNSKLVNFQMTEYVKWHVLMQLGII